jgi:alpha-beta hydrolase superfamily lysophospholipase
VDFTTLDVRTADGHTLKVGAYPGGAGALSILILHGLYSHMGWYRRLGAALAERGAAVFLLDRRGAGLSEGLAGHMDSWRQVVDDILRVVARIKALQPAAKVCGIGISLGAAMLVATSLVQRDSFHRHAVLSPGLAPAMRIPLRRRVGVAYSAFARPHVLYELPFSAHQLCDREEVRNALWEDPLRTRAVTSRFLLELFRLQRYVRQNLVQLPTPLLALLAGRDTLVDNQATLEILKRVQRVPIHVDEFQGANHVLPASVPLAELVGRIWHWFSAPESGLDPRLVIQQVPAFPTPTEACEWR